MEAPQKVEFEENRLEEDESDDGGAIDYFADDVECLIQSGLKNRCESLKDKLKEINSARISSSRDCTDALILIMPILMESFKDMHLSTSQEIIAFIQKKMQDWKLVFDMFCAGVDGKMCLIKQIEGFCIAEGEFQKGFHWFIQILYKIEDRPQK